MPRVASVLQMFLVVAGVLGGMTAVSYFLVKALMNAIQVALPPLPDGVTASCSETGCTQRATRGRSVVVSDLSHRGKHWYEAGTAAKVYCDQHRPRLGQLHPGLCIVLALALPVALILAAGVIAMVASRR
jgi:hypothetical protein